MAQMNELTPNESTYTTVAGYFPSEQSAETAVRALRDAGFSSSQIGIVGRPEDDGFTTEDQRENPRLTDSIGQSRDYVADRKPGFWQRMRELFEGDSGESYRDNSADVNLAGQQVTGNYNTAYDYDADDFHRSLQGLPEERSRYFSNRFSRDRHGVLVTVQAGDRRAEAEAILQENGADIGNEMTQDTMTQDTGNRFSQQTQTGVPASATNPNGSPYAELPADEAAAASFNRTTTPSYADRPARDTVETADLGRTMGSQTVAETASTASDALPTQRMQLYGEVLRIHRDRVERGEVRLRKETVTETQTVRVPVTREELVLERVPAEGEQVAPGAEIGQEAEIRIPLSEERVLVEKEPVLREEVRVGKREVTNVESHDETLRRDELRVDDDTQKRRAS